MEKQVSKTKLFLSILTIGNIGLHHILLGNWQKSLPLLISFVFCLFSIVGNIVMAVSAGEGSVSMAFGEALLFQSSIFTKVFLISFTVNRLLWIREFFLFLKGRLN